MALLKRGDDGLVDVAPGCFFDPLTGERRARKPKSKLDYGTSILTLDILGMSPGTVEKKESALDTSPSTSLDLTPSLFSIPRPFSRLSSFPQSKSFWRRPLAGS